MRHHEAATQGSIWLPRRVAAGSVRAAACRPGLPAQHEHKCRVQKDPLSATAASGGGRKVQAAPARGYLIRRTQSSELQTTTTTTTTAAAAAAAMIAFFSALQGCSL